MGAVKKRKEILACVTGSISAYKVCDLVRRLKERNYGVTVLMTEEATRFVSPLTFKTLTGRAVIKDMFYDQIGYDPYHIALAEKADVIVVVPATAHIIAKLAYGLCDDIISCVIMATKAKILIAPAMNDNMYKHKVLQENLRKVKSFGYSVISPVRGRLASGKVGVGHLAKLETILQAIDKSLK